MKSSTSQHHRIILTAALTAAISFAGAQPSPPENTNGDQYPYAKFSPSMAIIVVVLIAAFFFMGFFSIYIRHCSDAPAGSVRRALSLRSRRAAAACGLDASVIETFPTFSYSEVKDHKIGKGALECAVCLNEFEENETLRLLPQCDHVFHPECIDAWLGSHVTCPVCRANLDEPVQAAAAELPRQDDEEVGHGEIVIHVDGNGNEQDGGSMNRVPSFEYANRSRSIRRVFGFGKFRSHSTGHSLVQPGQNLDRFTLRLPKGVRKEVMDRAALNRTGSCATALPRVESSRRGYRTGGGGEGSGRGRFYRRLEGLDRGAKSDRWVFFTRGLSMRSPKVVAEGGEGSGGGGGGPLKLPSFKCLEPKAVDEAGLISDDRSNNPV